MKLPDSRKLRPIVSPRAKKRLAVLTCHFNPCGYQSLRRNYERFLVGMAASEIPVYTIELALGETPFWLTPAENVVQVRTNSVMWHKENLLNVLICKIPPQFDCLAWIDADLWFTNPDWPTDTLRELDQHPVVQMFEHAVPLTQDGQPICSRIGIAAAGKQQHPQADSLSAVHPGFAWAARRELLDAHGLFSTSIVGSGDSMMCFAMYGWWNHPRLCEFSPALIEDWLRWGRPFYKDVRGQVGFVPGTVLHMWHGSNTNRRYVERNTCLVEHHFDPATDLRANADGVWEWSGTKPGLSAAVTDYFPLRKEDE